MTAGLHSPPPIDTKRLTVRTVQESDLPELLVANGHDEVTRYLPYATWSSMADAQAWLECARLAQASGSTLQWAVVDKASATVIGSCLLFQYDAPSARAELGYVLGRAHWGQGLMREALVGVLDCAFYTLALRRIEAEVDPRNLASGKLLKSLGFEPEGILRARWVAKGETRDVESFGLLRSEWRVTPTAAA